MTTTFDFEWLEGSLCVLLTANPSIALSHGVDNALEHSCGFSDSPDTTFSEDQSLNFFITSDWLELSFIISSSQNVTLRDCNQEETPLLLTIGLLVDGIMTSRSGHMSGPTKQIKKITIPLSKISNDENDQMSPISISSGSSTGTSDNHNFMLTLESPTIPKLSCHSRKALVFVLAQKKSSTKTPPPCKVSAGLLAANNVHTPIHMLPQPAPTPAIPTACSTKKSSCVTKRKPIQAVTLDDNKAAKVQSLFSTTPHVGNLQVQTHLHSHEDGLAITNNFDHMEMDPFIVSHSQTRNARLPNTSRTIGQANLAKNDVPEEQFGSILQIMTAASKDCHKTQWQVVNGKYVHAKQTKFQRDKCHKWHVTLATDLGTMCQSFREEAVSIAKKHGWTLKWMYTQLFLNSLFCKHWHVNSWNVFLKEKLNGTNSGHKKGHCFKLSFFVTRYIQE
ncbi:hypothetical protein EV363DRAFT_1305048 [Boletus edulis]|nr:hypothetical protein EV363DRAFT_1305048 [Boletus edulis]